MKGLWGTHSEDFGGSPESITPDLESRIQAVKGGGAEKITVERVGPFFYSSVGGGLAPQRSAISLGDEVVRAHGKGEGVRSLVYALEVGVVHAAPPPPFRKLALAAGFRGLLTPYLPQSSVLSQFL